MYSLMKMLITLVPNCALGKSSVHQASFIGIENIKGEQNKNKLYLNGLILLNK